MTIPIVEPSHSKTPATDGQEKGPTEGSAPHQLSALSNTVSDRLQPVFDLSKLRGVRVQCGPAAVCRHDTEPVGN